MSIYREDIVKTAEKYLGCKESDGSHKKIIDRYNAHKPLARGYKVKYTDAWCATFGSAVAIECKATNIIPTECGCEEQIKLFRKIGSWEENDAYIPQPGDYIYYDWDDSGKGDNKGYTEHVGIVQKVADGIIYVIEGNYSNSVKIRKIQVNGKYIRGYGVPKYDVKKEAIKPVVKYTVTTALHLREGAGVSNKKLTVMPRGSVVTATGKAEKVGDTTWYQVKYKSYTGFCSGKYLKK